MELVIILGISLGETYYYQFPVPSSEFQIKTLIYLRGIVINATKIN